MRLVWPVSLTVVPALVVLAHLGPPSPSPASGRTRRSVLAPSSPAPLASQQPSSPGCQYPRLPAGPCQASLEPVFPFIPEEPARPLPGSLPWLVLVCPFPSFPFPVQPCPTSSADQHRAPRPLESLPSCPSPVTQVIPSSAILFSHPLPRASPTGRSPVLTALGSSPSSFGACPALFPPVPWHSWAPPLPGHTHRQVLCEDSVPLCLWLLPPCF